MFDKGKPEALLTCSQFHQVHDTCMPNCRLGTSPGGVAVGGGGGGGQMEGAIGMEFVSQEGGL